MIASDYLDYRARLDAAILSLAEAARRSRVTKAGHPVLLRQLVGALMDPFLIVVAGESGAGKSMFLNALAGADFCDAEDLAQDPPTPESTHQPVSYFKFGETPRDVPAGAGLVEQYRDCEFLSDFEVVELPGTGAAGAGAPEVVERFVPMADLVVAVISVADAWTPGVWGSLDRVRLGLGKDPLVVLGGCDLRSEDEVRAVVEHMELTMGRRYGALLPIFPMSAENAFLARTNPAAGGEAKVGESGILEFERYVSMQLLASDARMGKFDNVLVTARQLLDELGDPIAQTERILGGDGDLLEGLKAEINSRYEATNGKIREEFFKGLDSGHAAAVAAAQAELAAATGWGSLPGQVLGAGRKLVAGLGERFRDRVVAVTEARVIGAMTAAEEDTCSLWEKLSARLSEGFDHQLSADDGTGKAVWSGRGENLLRRAEVCAQKACADFDIDAAVGEQMRHGAIALRFFAISAVVLAAAAAVLLGMGLAPFHLLVGGLALVALGFGAGQFLDGRRKLEKALAARAEAGRIQLRADLNNELTSHVHEYYTKLGTLFDPVQELCQRQVAEVGPEIAALRGLDQEVAQLTTELAVRRAEAREFFKQLR